MILSATHKANIPAFYGKCFVDRLETEFICVRNFFACSFGKPKQYKSFFRQKIAKLFEKIAENYQARIKTCTKWVILNGIQKVARIGKNLIEEPCNYKIYTKKNKIRSERCNCIKIVDIGEYDICFHLCKYCYVNKNCKTVKGKISQHNHNSPLLIIKPSPTNKIVEREIKSLKLKFG